MLIVEYDNNFDITALETFVYKSHVFDFGKKLTKWLEALDQDRVVHNNISQTIKYFVWLQSIRYSDRLKCSFTKFKQDWSELNNYSVVLQWI